MRHKSAHGPSGRIKPRFGLVAKDQTLIINNDSEAQFQGLAYAIDGTKSTAKQVIECTDKDSNIQNQKTV